MGCCKERVLCRPGMFFRYGPVRGGLGAKRVGGHAGSSNRRLVVDSLPSCANHFVASLVVLIAYLAKAVGGQAMGQVSHDLTNCTKQFESALIVFISAFLLFEHGL